MTRVLVFGGALMDFVPEGERWLARAGGSAWNVARCLAALGAQASFVGTLGRDPFGEQLWAEGQAAGLDLRFAGRVDAPTALSVIHPAPHGYAFYAQGGADSAFMGVPEAAWLGAQAAYFGGVTLLRAPAPFLACAREAGARGLPLLLDLNHRTAYAQAGRQALRDYLPYTTLLKLSDEDLAGLLPEFSEAEALAWLFQQRPGLSVLLTRGAAGAELISAQTLHHHPGFPVALADSVGAGDASAAGWLWATLTHHPDPLAFALACGAVACTRRGAHAPGLAEVQRLQEEYP